MGVEAVDHSSTSAIPKTMGDVENPSSGSSAEIPQAQATLIGGCPNDNNACPFCSE
ncbi:hypothetical protein DAPPUDRAFT_236052 [Daphnia pulex]|uniref:Uncharacterized protein n=1 Tax=Daphnia pulex TaxID=6669 RepID=E9FZT9_DAPPU|nr:hypothetical protein DAPPUDRAFT_236052 [Daphnia pulex]|eukprot:EFX87205.1 hypothetical protein DAPPUDRAFT_236052 [Daphnia pulex]